MLSAREGKTMSKFILCIIGSFLFSTGCRDIGKNTVSNETKVVEEPTKVTKTYFLNHDIRNINYEIFVNDSLLAQSHNGDGIPAPYELTAYLKDSGKQQIHVKVIPDGQINKAITPGIVKEINKNLGIYLLEGKDYGNAKEIKHLSFPEINSDLPHYEYTWEFEVGDVPNIQL
ncbi:Uncharacterised protein [Sphingobacterium spiritivorum]|uniref:Lipoprotein n=2 Tax=Sphingobacterium spiritivorum TaxID=258 RepID=D7VQX8_SPHSI|nr:hypothetical protein HMPREF0766_13382 [Sphingobacterium spiritivorum ATCC 33861]QQT35714.1 hypothetical protein I6J01_21050 [Sphingobacterium spiritivorum]SUJ09293.1 Uncharacterised protein [Sphingobacterium spiritivorum]